MGQDKMSQMTPEEWGDAVAQEMCIRDRCVC